MGCKDTKECTCHPEAKRLCDLAKSGIHSCHKKRQSFESGYGTESQTGITTEPKENMLVIDSFDGAVHSSTNTSDLGIVSYSSTLLFHSDYFMYDITTTPPPPPVVTTTINISANRDGRD
mmetsp:Transcript_5323/g.6143  ORF Transcript_5323/g.6143 Transcript_5323/m.6143 type:complete len:120 (-) Transcript_5323:72-431(-)